MSRRRPEFEPALATSKQLNFCKLSDADGLQFSGCRRRQKPILQVVSVYNMICVSRINKVSLGEEGLGCFIINLSSNFVIILAFGSK